MRLAGARASDDVDAVEIRLCRLGDDGDIALAAAAELLSADEAARAARFHFDRDRERFIRGRGFLRQSLGELLGQAPAALSFTEVANGKPGITGDPIWFNLSHSGDLAALALSAETPVGVDLELVDRAGDLEGLARICFTEDEIAALEALPKPARRRRFLEFWTAKEARMKLTGEGMSLAPKRIALALAEGRPTGYLRPQLPSATLRFVDLPLRNAICCFAIRN